jgi:predicted transcriptional regulator
MADTTIKISEELRDRLRVIADERGQTTRAVVEEFISSTRTKAEREAAVAHNIAVIREHFGIEVTEDTMAASRARLAELTAQARRQAGAA